jgi:hypothetical protein
MRAFILLALLPFPVFAQEVQIDFTGLTEAHQPYTVQFDVNTASGDLFIADNPGCLENAVASDLAVSNLSINGKFQPTATVSLGLISLGSGCTDNAYSNQIVIGKILPFPFNMQFASSLIPPSTSVAQILLETYNRLDPNGFGDGSVEGVSADVTRMSATIVPEPGVLGLLLLGTVLIAFAKRRWALFRAATVGLR